MCHIVENSAIHIEIRLVGGGAPLGKHLEGLERSLLLAQCSSTASYISKKEHTNIDNVEEEEEEEERRRGGEGGEERRRGRTYWQQLLTIRSMSR